MKYIIVFLSFFTLSCSEIKCERDYFVGVWQSGDGAKILLRKDGTLEANHFNFSNILNNQRTDKVNFKGEWEFTTDDYNNEIIKIKSLLPSGNAYYFNFEIAGKGIFGNKPPLILYTFIGDPDDIVKYEFVKKI